EDRLLQPPVRLAQVDRVLERLLVGVAQALLRLLQLSLPHTRALVERLEIARVGQGPRQGYTAGHSEASGTSVRTSVKRVNGENGWVRWWSAPAAMPRRRSSAWAEAVSMTMRVCAHSGSWRRRRHASRPLSLGICTSSSATSGRTLRASSTAAAPSDAETIC